MGSKKTTKQTASSTTTAAPPSWTAPGLQEVGNMVLPALAEVQGLPRYDGQFNAIPGQEWIDQIAGDYGDARQQAGLGADLLRGMIGQTAGAGPTYDASQLYQGGMQFGEAPQLSNMQDLLALAPSFAELQGTQNLLDAPDFRAMMPGLAATPDFVNWNPTAFQADDGGARLDAALEAAIQPVMRQLTQQVLPGIRSSAIEAGAYTGGHAMQVLPEQAIAEASQRAAEITQQLAYQGFQQEEARRLGAWQALQEMQGRAAEMENQFNTNIWSGTNDFNQGLFSTLAGAEASTFGARQNAATQQGSQLLNALTQMYGINADAMLGFDRNAIDVWGQQNQNQLREAELLNQAYGLSTTRGLGDFQAQLAGNQSVQDMLMDSLMLETSQGDLSQQILNMVMGRDQAQINDALARDQYGIEAPFRGMDIATQLLTALSGNYGTQTGQSQATTVEKTGGLGNVVQGLAGLAMGAGSLMSGGGLGAAGGLLGSASGAAPASNMFKFGRNGLENYW